MRIEAGKSPSTAASPQPQVGFAHQKGDPMAAFVVIDRVKK